MAEVVAAAGSHGGRHSSSKTKWVAAARGEDVAPVMCKACMDEGERVSKVHAIQASRDTYLFKASFDISCV